jgi:hypothetical protein
MPEMPTKDIRDSAGLAGRSKDIAAQNAEPTDAEMERGILDAMRLGLGDVARTLSTRLQDRRRAHAPANVLDYELERAWARA